MSFGTLLFAKVAKLTSFAKKVVFVKKASFPNFFRNAFMLPVCIKKGWMKFIPLYVYLSNKGIKLKILKSLQRQAQLQKLMLIATDDLDN